LHGYSLSEGGNCMKRETLRRTAAAAGILVMSFMLILPVHLIQAASKKKTMYVISEITTKSGDESYQFAYNDKGLIKKEVNGSLTNTFSYKGKNISEENQVFGKEKTKLIFSYNKKGKLTKIVTKEEDGKKTTVKYSYKSGKVSEIKDEGTGSVWTLTYNGKGLVKKAVIRAVDGSSSSIRYWYNSQKDLKKMTTSGDVKESLSYKYNKYGRKSVTVKYEYKDKSQNTSEVYSYKYKKIKVPASYVKAVKAQQMDLANEQIAYLLLP